MENPTTIIRFGNKIPKRPNSESKRIFLTLNIKPIMLNATLNIKSILKERENECY